MGNFTIVSGGPGTGKTSIVLNILRLFSRRGVGPSRMVIAAPTGRAAMRLTESIRKGLRSIEQPDSRDSALSDMEAVTIHRLLQFSPMKNSFAYNREQTLPADLIIIDEASMIDITLLGALLDAVNQGATMVLLGDKNQLPSVEAGAVLADLMPDGVMARYSATALSLLDEVCQGAAARYGALADRDDAARVDRFLMLDQSYRSGKDILEIAHRIIADPLDLAAYIPPIHSSALAATGIFRIDPLESGNSLEAVLARWASLNFLDTAGGPSFRDLARMAARYSPEHLADEEFRSVIQGLFAFIDRSRIISPTRRGPWGIEAVNRRMGAIMSRDLSQAALYGPSDLAEPVIMTRNDYSRDLFNGDVGIALTASDGARHVFFSGLQGFRCFPVHALSGLEAAWAITVHKSQGSEYDRVLLLMSDKNDRLLTREILYTAITRARDLAVMYADAPTINRAAASRMERESGISLPSPC
jgi:exodeoxyribonuclease V alpha subunit